MISILLRKIQSLKRSSTDFLNLDVWKFCKYLKVFVQVWLKNLKINCKWNKYLQLIFAVKLSKVINKVVKTNLTNQSSSEK